MILTNKKHIDKLIADGSLVKTGLVIGDHEPTHIVYNNMRYCRTDHVAIDLSNPAHEKIIDAYYDYHATAN